MVVNHAEHAARHDFLALAVAQSEQHFVAVDRFAAAVSRWPEVADCYLMTGQRDYLLRIIVSDLAAYERFLKDKLTRLDNVASIESSFALGRVKRSYSVPVELGRS